jgi:uncharacterized membrane protein YsdA (DUF1294 family)
MTLQDLFVWLGQHPAPLLAFFALLPLSALLLGLITKNKTYNSDWRYGYSALVYLACVPGIFAVALSAYFFLFERRSILQTDVFTQVLPVAVMLFTLWIIRRSLPFAAIPGFKKISGLMLMIFCALSLMWFIDRTHIMVFAYLPFQYLLGIFGVLLGLMVYGWNRFF